MANNDTMTARERRAQILQWHIGNDMTQREIAEHLGITRVRVGQIIRHGYNDIVKGKISLPYDYDISKNKTLVDTMLFYACMKSWENFDEVNQNYQVLSQLTTSDQLAWIKKSRKIRWYK